MASLVVRVSAMPGLARHKHTQHAGGFLWRRIQTPLYAGTRFMSTNNGTHAPKAVRASPSSQPRLELLNSSRGRLLTTSTAGSKGDDQNTERESVRYLGMLFFAGCGAVTLYLGTWQLNRYSWKVDLIESRERSLKEGFVNAPEGSTFKEWEEAHYKRLNLTGIYLHDYAMYVGPRSAPSGGVAAAGGGLITSPGRETGYYLVTPFRMSSTGQVLLLNRGWLPRSMKDSLPPEALPKGEVSIIAVPRPLEKPGTLVAQNDPAAGNWFFIDPEEMGAALGMPFIPPFCEVFEEESKPRNAFPKNLRAGDLINFHVMPITHLAYSATWYGLSAAIAVGTYFRFKPRR